MAQEDVSVETIIIVGVICGTIVLALFIVLLVMCFRRYSSQKKYVDSKNNYKTKPTTTTSAMSSTHQPVNTDMVDGPLKIAVTNASKSYSPDLTKRDFPLKEPYQEESRISTPKAKKVLYEVVV